MAKGMLGIAVHCPSGSCGARRIRSVPVRPQVGPKEVSKTGVKEQKVPAA